jgi:hypothetical protein
LRLTLDLHTESVATVGNGEEQKFAYVFLSMILYPLRDAIRQSDYSTILHKHDGMSAVILDIFAIDDHVVHFTDLEVLILHGQVA